jgi:serine/threonine protein kinase
MGAASSTRETYVFGYLDAEEMLAQTQVKTKQALAATKKGGKVDASEKSSEKSLLGPTLIVNKGALGPKQQKGRSNGRSTKDILRGAVKETIAATILREAGANRKRRPKRPNTTSIIGWISTDIVVGRSTDMNKFDEVAVIGAGLTGTIRLSKCKLDGRFCALKCVRKDWVSKNKCAYHLEQEKVALTSLESPFVVDCFGTFQSPHWLVFVMEYVPGGELFRQLSRQRNGRLGIETAKFYSVEILGALEFIHEKGLVYRDLKPENVLIDEFGHIKMCDFGFATPQPQDGKCHTFVGTPCYLSPEQLNGKKTDGYRADLVDWWAWACLVYELVSGRTPFESESGKQAGDESRFEIYLRVLKGKVPFPVRVPGPLKTLICALLDPNVDKRLYGAGKVKKQEWLRDIQWQWVRERCARPPWVPSLKDEGDHHYYKDHAVPLEKDIDEDAIRDSDFLNF